MWFGRKRGISRPHSSKLSERLAKKIEEQTGTKCDPSSFRRTYAGYWQRSCGAWVWTMDLVDIPDQIGSCDPASLCVRKDYKLVCISNGEIVAEKINIQDDGK